MPDTIPSIIGILIVCGVAGAVIGSQKNAAALGFVLGLCLGPIGVIAAFAIDKRQQCPKCRGRLNGAATVCQHCGAALERTQPEEPPDLPRAWDEDKAEEAEIIRRMREKRERDLGT